jgi:hypothetical protein
MKSRRKKLLPAVLALTATGCDNGPEKCDPAKTLCKPDGGFYCTNNECFPAMYADGGIQYDATGQAICLC